MPTAIVMAIACFQFIFFPIFFNALIILEADSSLLYT